MCQQQDCCSRVAAAEWPQQSASLGKFYSIRLATGLQQGGRPQVGGIREAAWQHSGSSVLAGRVAARVAAPSRSTQGAHFMTVLAFA